MPIQPALDITPVILAGGSGTRLWPLSRTQYPKQFLPIGADTSLLSQTVARAATCCTKAPVVIANEDHRFLTAEQLKNIPFGPATILLEPAARNTAPAIAAAAWHLAELTPDAMMVVMPADHLIRDTDAFASALALAVEPAMAGAMVTFGIRPAAASTAYGYVKVESTACPEVHKVEEFVEKPDRASAECYVKDGNYLWNAGIFMFTANTFLAALEALEPQMHALTKLAVDNAKHDLDFIRLDAEPFKQTRSDSIDYAIMERVDNRALVPLRADWSDVGSWETVYESSDPDNEGNVLVGDALTLDSQDCYIHADSRLVAAIGLKDIGIIETSDSILVTDLSRSQDTKRVAELLQSSNRGEANLHRRVYRPWGSYESLATGTRFQVKRIIVKPGAKLSLQKHFHRAEHWIVVTGTALVTVGTQEIILSENQSTYIPLGELHRLDNPGSIDLVLIEVQSGSYLGEDDIVRFDDVYGRG